MFVLLLLAWVRGLCVGYAVAWTEGRRASQRPALQLSSTEVGRQCRRVEGGWWRRKNEDGEPGKERGTGRTGQDRTGQGRAVRR